MSHMKSKSASSVPLVAVFLSLSEEQMFRDGSSVALERFISESRFPFNSGCDQFVVILPKKGIQSGRRLGSKLVLMSKFELYAISKPNVAKALLNAFRHNYDFGIDGVNSKRGKTKKFLSRLKSEMLSLSLDGLDGKRFKIRYLVGTNSYFVPGLPRIFSRETGDFQRILIWYSINSIPISQDEIVMKSYLSPSFKNWIDDHFVWDEFQRSDLIEQGVKNASVKGSMLFYPRGQLDESAAEQNGSLKIVFFDVTPLKLSQGTFYATQPSIRTLLSLIQLRKILAKSLGRGVEIALKPKRVYSTIHDPSYIEIVNDLKLRGEISVLPAGINLYHEISKADLVLSPPFSSPCIVAKELEVLTAFYFLSDSTWKLPNSHHGIKVITNLQDLVSLSTSVL